MATLNSVFTDIAEAINNKGVSGAMKPTEMAEKIASIPTGGESWTQLITIDDFAEHIFCEATLNGEAI